MILPLRQRHRRIFIGLAIFLPAVFVLGIAARKAVPVAGEIAEPPANISAAPVTDLVATNRTGAEKIFPNPH